MPVQYLFSLTPTFNMDNTLSRETIFIIFAFSMKSPSIIDNIFQGLTYRFYILLLVDIIFHSRKKKIVN